LIPSLQAHGLGLLPYFPLASGLLTGKYKHGQDIPGGTRMALMKRMSDRYMTDANWDIVGKLGSFCAERGHGLLELAFSWLAARPQLSSVIAGATKPEQIEANVKAVEWKLSADEIAEVDRLTKKA
jgi:aryl-alcohol dehydrogenase-like predicted oxidoreductase